MLLATGCSRTEKLEIDFVSVTGVVTVDVDIAQGVTVNYIPAKKLAAQARLDILTNKVVMS